KPLAMILALLTLLSGGTVRTEERPTAKTSLEQLLESLSAIHRFKEVAISPDGRRVAWVEDLPAKGDAPSSLSSIYLADLHSPDAAPRRISADDGTTAHAEHGLTWSPDGSQLAFLSDKEKKEQLQLYLAPAEGGPVRKVTNLIGHLAGPRWAPTGKQ